MHSYNSKSARNCLLSDPSYNPVRFDRKSIIHPKPLLCGIHSKIIFVEWFLNQPRISMTFYKFVCCNFFNLPRVHKIISAFLTLFNGPTVKSYLLHLSIQSCLLKTSLRTQILVALISFYVLSLSELILNCIMFL